MFTTADLCPRRFKDSKRQEQEVLCFEPAEDSKPDGEEGSAELMIREGVLDNPKPGAIFGLHVVRVEANFTPGESPHVT